MGSKKKLQALRWVLIAVVVLFGLYVVSMLYVSGQAVAALMVLTLFATGVYVYGFGSSVAWRYLYPGIAGMMVFVVFPLLFTVEIGFTNYSSTNLLSYERATNYLLEQSVAGEKDPYVFTLHEDGAEFRIRLSPKEGEDVAQDAASEANKGTIFVSVPLALRAPKPPIAVQAQPLEKAGISLGEALPMSAVIKHRDALSKLVIQMPDGTQLSYAGLREFGVREPLWTKVSEGVLKNNKTGELATANRDTGFYTLPSGETVQPGFKVGIGWGNYARMVNDPEFRGPFLSIFAWTVIFSGLTVLLTLAVGATLAVLLNWESLKFRTVYRTLLFLPYAVPGFISILVWRGLFNQNFGEINYILSTLFGIKPAWFADPTLAKAMLLIVNTWLGYPYVMILVTGLIKSIPSDLYEASALAGASPLTNFFKITLPLVMKPLTPLLIASFAFNFNNFVLIALLTGGRPDFINTKVPAGTTDILVSYTYRIAFQDSGQNFGLAAAISTVIFILVALLSAWNLKLMKVNQQEGK